MKQVAGKVPRSQVGRRLRYVQCNVTLEIFKEDKGGMFSPKQFHCKLFGFKTEILGIKDFLWHSNVESSLLVFVSFKTFLSFSLNAPHVVLTRWLDQNQVMWWRL